MDFTMANVLKLLKIIEISEPVSIQSKRKHFRVNGPILSWTLQWQMF
jgi:hypothetical protein